MTWAWVAAGGAAGSVCRFTLGGWVARRAGDGFPWGTLAVNVAGSLLLGILLAALPEAEADPLPRALLAVGFCGGFTTFSTFSYEAVALAGSRAWGAALAYVGASVVASLTAVALGLWVGTRAR